MLKKNQFLLSSQKGSSRTAIGGAVLIDKDYAIKKTTTAGGKSRNKGFSDDGKMMGDILKKIIFYLRIEK